MEMLCTMRASSESFVAWCLSLHAAKWSSLSSGALDLALCLDFLRSFVSCMSWDEVSGRMRFSSSALALIAAVGNLRFWRL